MTKVPPRTLTATTSHAPGAITILNATATGTGCALAIEGGVTARWQWHNHGDGLQWQTPNVDNRLAQAIFDHLHEVIPHAPPAATASTLATHPPSRGLKTSSSAAAALLEAGRNAIHAPLPPQLLMHEAVAVSRRAGVTLTGALDDQAAVCLGGCHLTNNHQQTILATLPIQPWHVAIWVPEAHIEKSQLGNLDATPIAKDIHHAETLARQGNLPAAMTHNGTAFHALYAEAGLPVTDEPTQVAMANGALGAGLSGTGPAVSALFNKPVQLPHVPGGTWTWTQTRPTTTEQPP